MRKGSNGEKKTGKKEEREKTYENRGHYIIACSRPPECRPLERRMLVPIYAMFFKYLSIQIKPLDIRLHKSLVLFCFYFSF